MVYNVLDVSCEAINYSNEKGYGISNLKLQKILYFIQAYFLITVDEKCFKEKIEAWDFGPVVPEVYSEFKQYGAGNIPSVSNYMIRDKNHPWNYEKKKFDSSVINENDKKRIRAVIDEFADYSATYLVSLTQSQAPWYDAYQKYKNNEITVDAIKEFFNNE